MHPLVQIALNQLIITFGEDLRRLGFLTDLEDENNPVRKTVEKIIEEDIIGEQDDEERLENLPKNIKNIECRARNCRKCKEEIDEKYGYELGNNLDPYCNIVVKRFRDWLEGYKQSLFSLEDAAIKQLPLLQALKRSRKDRKGRTEEKDHLEDLAASSERLAAADAVHAQTLIAEALLNRNREVEAFREKYLKEGLLKDHIEVKQFLEANEYKQDGTKKSFEVVRFAMPGKTWTQAVAVKNPLGRDLKALSKMLEPLWREHHAVFFLLTGRAAAPIRHAEIGLSITGPERPKVIGRLQSFSITLRLSPALPSSYAERAFAYAKKAFKELYPEERYKRIPKQERLLWLSVFVAQKLSKERKTWDSLMKEWNVEFLNRLAERFPEKRSEIEKWRYTSERVFANKARSALCGLFSSSWSELREIIESG